MMFNLLLGVVSDAEANKLIALVFCLWVLPFVVVVLTIVSAFKKKRGVRWAAYLLSLPTIIVGCAMLLRDMMIHPERLTGEDSMLSLVVTPLVIVIVCCFATWLGGKDNKKA